MTTATETNDALAAFGDPTSDTPPDDRVKLSDFEGLVVAESGIEIPDAAGGLRDALKVDPVELHKNERVYIVLACDVAKIRHDPIDTGELDGPQRRVHVLKTAQATIVDASLVKDALDKQQLRLAEAKEIAGQQKLDTDGTGDEPWLGYDELTPDEVVARLDDADTLDLVTLVEAYETDNGGRAPVLEACIRARGVLEGVKPKRGAKKATAK